MVFKKSKEEELIDQIAEKVVKMMQDVIINDQNERKKLIEEIKNDVKQTINGAIGEDLPEKIAKELTNKIEFLNVFKDTLEKMGKEMFDKYSMTSELSFIKKQVDNMALNISKLDQLEAKLNTIASSPNTLTATLESIEEKLNVISKGIGQLQESIEKLRSEDQKNKGVKLPDELI